MHEVVALIDGKAVAQNGIDVTQTFELSPTSGPVGTPVEVKVQRARLAYDGKHVGGELGQQQRRLGLGGKHARIGGGAVSRTGPVGNHVVKLYTGWQGQSYLNYEQSPGGGFAAAELQIPHDGG